MSKVVDERVVSMRFDNKHFEENVKTSMSTLDKLKQALRFDGANKGMNDMGGAVETVRTRFSSLQVMAVTALANITNSAVNAGKRIVSALTIDPVKTGFNEYELKMNSVQTIMASTGETLETVNSHLDELNKYSDRTIYSFADMTQNIGKFTNAGVKLEDAVLAMKGISNEAALSGANANEASRAMYNFSQALSVGYVQRIDWKSIELANMATLEFKEQLLESAIAAGTVKKSADGMYETLANPGKAYNASAMFTETLDDQWLTTEVLLGTLKDYADETTDIGKRATKAATEVKTFSQMMDTLKESAQSGWARTWELLFGDFNEGKALWTDLGDAIGGLLDKMSKWRNDILAGALGKGFGDLSKKVNGLLDPLKKTAKSINTVKDAAKDYSKVVDGILAGDWGNGQERWDKLAKAGYDWAHAQNLVNEKLGDGTRHATKYKEAQDGLTDSQKKSADAQEGLSKADKKTLMHLLAMSDAELKLKGYTDEQIKAFRELEATAEKLGMPLSEFLDKINEIDGRWLLVESLKNIGDGLVDVFKALKAAWQDIFPPKTVEERAEGLFNIIAALHKFTRNIRDAIYVDGEFTETGEKLVRTFKGIIAAIDLITSIVGGSFKFAFNLAKGILEYFNLDILDVTAYIGDAIVGFRNWIKRTFDLSKALDTIVPFFTKAIEAVKNWITTLKGSDNIPRDIIQGLINGLKNGIPAVWNAAVEIGKSILESIKNFLGIHSPSTKFAEVGGYIIDGLVKGMKDGFTFVSDMISSLYTMITNLVKNLNFGKIFIAIMGVGFLSAASKFAQGFKNFSEPFKEFGGFMDTLSDTIKDVGKAYKKNLQSKTILNFAYAIAILAASVTVLALLPYGKLWSAVGAIIVLAGVIVALSFAMKKVSGENAGDIAKFSVFVFAIGLALMLVTKALKNLDFIDKDNFLPILGTFAAIILGIGLLLKLFGKIDVSSTANIDKLGGALLKMAIALGIMTLVMRLTSGMDESELKKGALAIAAFGGIIVGLMAATKLISGSKNVESIGKTILSISAAILVMVLTAKLAARMSKADLIKGALAITAFGAIIVGLMTATKLVSGSKNVEKIGLTILAVSGAILIMMLTAKLAASMSAGEIAKGTIAIAAFGAMIVGLMAATKLVSGSKNVGKIGLTILAIAGAIAIMAASVLMLSFISVGDIAKGVIAISALGIIMAIMIRATENATDCKANLIAMAASLAIIAASIAILSFVDPSKLAGATVALGSLMGIFALIILASSKASKSMGSLIVMTVAIGLIAGAIYLLAQVPWEQSLAAAGALSLVLLSLTGSLILISKFGSTATMAMIPLAVMTVVVIVLAQVIKSLATIPFESAMGAVIALSVLLTALTGALLLLGVVGMMWAPALIGIAVLGGFIVAMGALIAGLGWLATNVEGLQGFLDTGLPILGQIGTGIGMFFGNIVAAFSSAVLSVIPALGQALGDFMTNIQPFIEGAKNIDGGVLKGIGMLSLAIIALTAADFIAGIASFLQGGSSFAQLGMELSAFMIAVTPFLMGASMINPSMMEGVKSLADTILILTKADLINGLTSWITGGSSLETFGAQLGGLGTNLATFAANLGTFDESKVTTITCAANAIKAMASAAETLPNEGGWLAKIVGDNSISTFGSYLPGLGTNIASFATNLGTFTEAQVATVTCAANAIKAMAEAAEGIPNEGGWLGKIVGDNSIATFGAYLPDLGKNLTEFATNLGTFDEAKVSTVTCAANAIKAMAEAAGEIPNEGGWLAKIVGDNSIATFGGYLPDLGTNIASFATNLGEFSEDKVATVTCAANAIKAMATAADGLPNEGGWLAKIVGDNSIETFGGYLPKLGTNLSKFAANLGTFGESQIASINWAVKAIQALAKLGEVGLEKMADNIKSFGNKLPDFATKVSEFADELSVVAQSNLNKAVKNVEIIKDMLVNLDGVSGKEGNNFKKSLGDLATSSVKKFTEAFSGANKTDVVSAVKKMIEAAIKAVEGKQKDFKKAFTDSASKAAKAIKSETYYDKFKDAGKYLVKGFAAGIEANTYKAEAKARAMAKAAAEAAEDELDINSPSKVFRKIGMSVPEGFAQGIDRLGGLVKKSSVGMADNAVKGVSKSIARLAEVVNTDIDTQPTIRPVLDLSNVESGANAIGSMLGLTPSLDLLTNVGSISTMMNRRNQNGVNDDVVSAIHDLRDGISGMGNSYNINGVTYNEGSDVAEAIQTIIRAATVERRI